MLLQRIITGIVLAAISLAVIFYFGDLGFIVLIGIFTTLAAWEWSRLAGWEKLWQQIFYAGIVGFPPFFLALPNLESVLYDIQLFPSLLSLPNLESILYYIQHFFFSGLLMLFFVSPILWVLILIKLIRYQSGINLKVGFKSLLGFFLLSTAWFSLVLLKDFGVEWLLFALGLVWVSDIGAFFVGKRFGKHKLADQISPGKTVEGALGALLFGGLLGIFFVFYKGNTVFTDSISGILFIGLSLITVIFSIVGDLFESLLKRKKEMKDSSQLLPGHGGVLDRLDSIIAAAPIFWVGIRILQELNFVVFR